MSTTALDLMEYCWLYLPPPWSGKDFLSSFVCAGLGWPAEQVRPHRPVVASTSWKHISITFDRLTKSEASVARSIQVAPPETRTESEGGHQ